MIGAEENLAAARADHAVFVQRHPPIIILVTSHPMCEWKASELALEFVISENYQVVRLRRFQFAAGRRVGQRLRVLNNIKRLSFASTEDVSWRRRRSGKGYFIRIGVLDFQLAAACTGSA